MDGDISCFWLLALVRNKNNNEVTEVNCQSYIVMSCHRFFLMFIILDPKYVRTYYFITRPCLTMLTQFKSFLENKLAII